MQSGCGPGDCLGWCDKTLMSLCVEGHVGRFAAAQFGHKVSNTGLAIVTDVAVVYAGKSWKSTLALSWMTLSIASSCLPISYALAKLGDALYVKQI